MRRKKCKSSTGADYAASKEVLRWSTHSFFTAPISTPLKSFLCLHTLQRTTIIHSPSQQRRGLVMFSLSDGTLCPCSPTVKQSVALFFRNRTARPDHRRTFFGSGALICFLVTLYIGVPLPYYGAQNENANSRTTALLHMWCHFYLLVHYPLFCLCIPVLHTSLCLSEAIIVFCYVEYSCRLICWLNRPLEYIMF